jgi:hypothetical protein
MMALMEEAVNSRRKRHRRDARGVCGMRPPDRRKRILLKRWKIEAILVIKVLSGRENEFTE